MRVMYDCGTLFSKLENFLSSNFIPALFSVEVSLSERIPLSKGD